MSYTTFAGARVWDGTEAVSVHGAAAAMGASIDGSLIPSFVDETARNTAAAPLIALGKTGMTCYVRSRLGTCTFIGIPAGGAPPVNGWVWHAQNRLIYGTSVGGLVQGSVGPDDKRIVANSGAVVLGGGQRFIEIAASCDLAPNPLMHNTNTMAARMGVYQDGGELFNGGAAIPVPVPGVSDTVCAQTVSRSQKFKVAAGTHTWTMDIYKYLGDGWAIMYNARFDVTDLGPVD